MGLVSRLFRESDHPRDARGRFIPKAAIGVRVSTRSASVTVGKRYPLIPGKVNVYGGVLLRVERANRGDGPIDRLIDKGTARLVNAVPEGTLRNIASSLANGQSVETNGLRVSGSGLKPQQPTLRVARSTTRSRPGGHSQTTGVKRERAPRQPRTRSGPPPGEFALPTASPRGTNARGRVNIPSAPVTYKVANTSASRKPKRLIATTRTDY